MTSDQKAVCGTCGQREGAMCACGFPLHRIRSHRYAGSVEPEGDPHHPFIPAPVVPSDDAPRREQYATSDEYRAAMVEWALSAPPTPSQDAEGDLVLGAALAELAEAEEWADRLAYAIAPVSVIGEHSSANNPWMNALEIVGQRESSIHAPYEELVKAARESHPRCEPWDTGTSRAGQACLTHDSRWPEGALDCGADPVNTALTRIEESLGGRK